MRRLWEESSEVLLEIESDKPRFQSATVTWTGYMTSVCLGEVAILNSSFSYGSLSSESLNVSMEPLLSLLRVSTPRGMTLCKPALSIRHHPVQQQLFASSSCPPPALQPVLSNGSQERVQSRNMTNPFHLSLLCFSYHSHQSYRIDRTKPVKFEPTLATVARMYTSN